MQSVSYVPTSLPEKSHVSSREWKGKLKNSSRDSSTLHEWWSLPEKENVGNQMTILLISKCEKFPLAVVSVNIYNWKVKAVEHVFQLASTYTIDTYCVYLYRHICLCTVVSKIKYVYGCQKKLFISVVLCRALSSKVGFLREITKHELSTNKFTSFSLPHSDAMHLHLHPPWALSQVHSSIHHVQLYNSNCFPFGLGMGFLASLLPLS